MFGAYRPNWDFPIFGVHSFSGDVSVVFLRSTSAGKKYGVLSVSPSLALSLSLSFSVCLLGMEAGPKPPGIMPTQSLFGL